jgi:hypothetical protein
MAEVKVSNNYAKVFNEKGTHISSIYLGSNDELIGYNLYFIVIKSYNYLKIYNSNGSDIGNSIYLS